MANKQMNFTVGIRTTYDAKGVNQLKNDLTSLASLGTRKSFFANFSSEAPIAIQAANTLKNALTQAYNPKLGTATLNRFNQSIKQSGMSLKEVQAGLHNFGVQGDMAFVKSTANLLKMNTVAKNTNTVFDKMFTTLKNTITWGMSSALWNSITGSIQKTYYYIKDLDTALNDIRIVTGKSNDEMAQFAKNANEAAKALGTSTRNYAEGSLIYYQQGLSDEEVKTRTDITAKTAMVTGQSMDQVSEQLTAVWNGYKVSAEEAELYIDRLAAVAATTASDLEELSTGMSKVASAAANLGVSESQLSAILATTISVTRQAPESVGTAYKTIFARISDIKAGLDTETTFGNYTSKMAEMGISVLDTTGNLRDMGEVIEEIGTKWATMTREQQISLAQTMAGTRQYNNLVALFDNWSNYEETLHTAENAAGTLAKQHNIALDSINSRLNILKATWEDLYQNLISSEDIKGIISALTQLANVLAFVTKSIGGLNTILPSVVSLFLQFGSARIGKEIGTYINEFIRLSDTTKTLKRDLEEFRTQLNQSFEARFPEAISEKQNQLINEMVNDYEKILQYKNVMSDSDQRTLNSLIDQKTELIEMVLKAEEFADYLEKARQARDNSVPGAMSVVPGEQKGAYSILDKIGVGQLVQEIQTANSGDEVIEQNITKLNGLSASISAVTNELDKEIATKNSDIDATTAVNQALDGMITEGELTAEQVEILKERFKEFAGTDTERIKSFNSELKQMAIGMRDYANNTKDAVESTKTYNDNMKEFSSSLDIKKVITDVSNLAGVLSSVGMAISQIISLTKTWQDDSLSTSEKVLRTLTAIGFILPTIIRSLTTLTEVQKTFMAGFTANQVIESSLRLQNQKLAEKEALEAERKALAEERTVKALAEESALRLKEKAEQGINSTTKAIEQLEGMAGGPEEAKKIFGSKYTDLEIERLNYQNQLKSANNDLAILPIQKADLDSKIANVDEKLEGVEKAANDAGKAAGEASTQTTSLIGKMGAFVSASPYVAAAIGAITVAIVALVAGMAIAEEAQKKETKRRLEALKTFKEEVDEREKEAQQLNELRDSYTNLKSQLDKNEITEIEYRNQVLALTKDIEDQTIKLQLLTGEYENLGKTMQEIAKQKNEGLIADYENEIRKSESTMQAAAVQGTNLMQDLWKSPLLNNGGTSWWSLFNIIPPIGAAVNGIGNVIKGADNKKEGITNQVINRSTFDLSANAELKKYFNENMSDIMKTGGPGGYQLSIQKDNIIEAYEKIDKAIQDNAHLANTETIKELTTIRDNMQEAYEIQKEAQDKMKELQKENLVYENVDEKTLTSAEAYYSQIGKLAQAALDNNIFEGEDAYNKARIWANSVLSGINEETAQWSKDVSLIDAIIYNTNNLSENDQKMLTSILEEGLYSDAQLKYLETKAYTLGLSLADKTAEGMKKELEKSLKQGENIISLYEKQAEKQKISSAMGLASQYKTFNNAETQKILKDTSLDTEEFRQSNYANQMIQAMDTLGSEELGLTEPEVEALKNNVSNEINDINQDISEVITKAIDENKDKIFKENLLGANRIDDEGNRVSMFITQEGESVGTQEEVNKALEDYIKGEEFLNDKDKEIIKKLKEKNILNEEELEKIREENTQIPKLVSSLNDYENKLNVIEDLEGNHVKNREDLINLSNDMSSATDDIQSAYKALSTATREWNLNEGLSIDTVQALVKMNPMYLHALEEQGGLLTVNTDKLNDYAKAEMHAAVNARAKADAELFAQLVDKDTKEQAYQEIMMLENLTGIQENYNDAIWESARAKVAEAYANENLKESERDLMYAKIDALQKGYGYEHQMVDKMDITKDNKSGGSKSKKDEKNYRDDFDRYWEFLKAIDKVAEAIEKLDKKEKNLFGKEKISSLKNKNQLLQQQIGTYQDLYEEQKREQAELMGSLGEKGLTFNAEGEITNYAKRTSEALAEYNEAVRKYNAGLLSEEAFKIAEKAYEDFKKELERYDKLYYSEMKDTMEKMEELRRQMLANNLEVWEIEIKLKVDWASLERGWSDFLHNIQKDFTAVYEDLEDQLVNINEKIATYEGDEGVISVDKQAIADVEAEIDKLKNGGQSDMFESISQAQEKLKELNETLQKDTLDYQKLVEEAYKTYLKMIDQLNDKLKEQMGRYEQIDKELAHQQKLIQLLYGDKAYGMMDTLYKNQEKNQLAEISSLRSQRDLWKEKWEAAEEGSQEQLKYYQLMIEAQNDLNSSVENYIELLQQDLANAVKKTLDELDKGLTNGLGIDRVKQEWDDMMDYEQGFFDENQRIFQIESFGLSIEQKMANASEKTQKALKAFQEEELERLKNKQDLSEYDIKAAEYRLQLKEQELALEDAQNAKNSMKLTRDSKGNWTYQYVADDADVLAKQQDLMKTTQDYYDFAKKSHQEIMERMMEATSTYEQTIADIMADVTLSEEEKQERMNEATEKYKKLCLRLSEQANIMTTDMAATAAKGLTLSVESGLIKMEDLSEGQQEIVQKVIDNNILEFEKLYKAVEQNDMNIRDDIIKMLEETVPEWRTAAQEMANMWNSDPDSIMNMVDQAVDEMMEHLEEYQEKLDELQETAGIDFDKIIDYINEATDATDDLKDAIEDMCEDNGLDDMRDQVYNLKEAWDKVADSMKDTIEKLKEYLKLAGQASDVSVNPVTPSPGSGDPGDGGSQGPSGPNGPNSPDIPTPGEGGSNYWWSINTAGNAMIGEKGKENSFAILDKKANGVALTEYFKRYGAASFKDTSESREWLERMTREGKLNGLSYKDLTESLRKFFQNVPKYKSGGYTGSWFGGDGRLAMLHSKELVLNADDTSNFLSAISMIRQIASFGTSLENTIAYGLNSFMERFSDKAYGLSGGNSSSNKTINFNINAPITSTSTTDEIQQAILNLPNLASQYVARNNI